MLFICNLNKVVVTTGGTVRRSCSLLLFVVSLVTVVSLVYDTVSPAQVER